MKDLNCIFYKTAQRSDMTILKAKKKKLDTDRWFDSDCKGAFTPDANEALSASDLHVKSMQRRE